MISEPKLLYFMSVLAGPGAHCHVHDESGLTQIDIDQLHLALTELYERRLIGSPPDFESLQGIAHNKQRQIEVQADEIWDLERETERLRGEARSNWIGGLCLGGFMGMCVAGILFKIVALV